MSSSSPPLRRPPSHVSSKIASHAHGAPFWSLEFFPPKTSQGQANLLARMARMNGTLSPQWNHVTWGAGGTTRDRSLDLAGRAQRGVWDPSIELGHGEEVDAEAALDACLHLTCTNVDKDSLDETLAEAKRLGIRNLLALRGDPPRGDEYWVAADSRFQRATDLVKYIRASYGDHFCIGVAGYPEGYCDSLDQDVERDVRFLKAKQDAGADFIVTQLFYDVDVFLQWYKRCREAGITIPILPGIMPIQNYSSFRRMTNLCRSKVPPSVLAALEPIRFDDAAVKEYGVQLSIAMVARIFLETDICGFHFCTLNLEKSVRRVLEGLGWVREDGKAASPDYKATTEAALAKALAAAQGKRADVATDDATWDEFPNGRYGDARSPAFGEIDGYGVSLKVPPADALRIWGYPVTDDDVSAIFSSYLVDKIQCIPWCDAPIFDETLAIQQWLLALNAPEKGWWTVGSQPAVDGVSSADPTYGFGPGNGYVYQKAFVEFFMSEADKNALAARIEREGNNKLTYFAGNRRRDYETNMPSGEVEAVTWGVFPGKEIAQPTIIEEESFKAWRDEAFDIWREWESLFPKRSATAKLLNDIGEKRWLVTVVHHDYKDASGLWAFLTGSPAPKAVSAAAEASQTVASAPGKVLIAGGYLVLSPAYPGLVISTDARFYSVIAAGEQPRSLYIRSPQFTKAEWHFDLDEETGALSLSAESASSPYAGRSPFLCLALVYSLALAYQRVPLPALRAKLANGLDITVVADNDFYSQPGAHTSEHLSSLPAFNPLNVAIRDVHKTGLGSSAALTTSLVSALLLHLGVVRTLEDEEDLALAHNTAQLAHCAAQGKVGSGFDVSSAVWGSQIYRRFDAKVLEPLLSNIPAVPTQGEGKPLSLRDLTPLGPHLDPRQQPLWKPSPLSAASSKQDANPTAFEGLSATTNDVIPRPAPLSLPPRISLLLADVDAGSNTPSLVSAVSAWRTKKPEWAKQLYDVIASSNSALADALAELALVAESQKGEFEQTLSWATSRKSSEWGGATSGCGHPGHRRPNTNPSTPSPALGALIAARDALRSTRAGMRELGRLSGAPVEPDSMGRVLTAAVEGVPGVLGGGVPGAGGYDALYVLYIDADGRRAALEETLRKAGEREKDLRVGVLLSGAGSGGVRVEKVDEVKGLRERVQHS